MPNEKSTQVSTAMAQPDPVRFVLKRPPPPNRRLRVFSTDPSLAKRVETAMLNETIVRVPWEETAGLDVRLHPGPVGEFVEVVDIDPASGRVYPPVDLGDPYLLAEDGLAPSEGNPQFHQQMVYAVAMTTIGHFEKALGRVPLWRDRYDPAAPRDARRKFVRRLRIYPHALREANAFYDPDRVALLFGYFPAGPDASGTEIPGGMVFTCLSHDIVAHETTHALLDGLHPRFGEPCNPDSLAFHEAFADIVAIFQHFSYPNLLRHQIASVRGNLGSGQLMADLARQFGDALGHSKALRSAIGTDPKTNNYRTIAEPHDRGTILVAAVFDAFLAIYARRTADLVRLASGGSGILAPGAILPDLIERLVHEAAKTAARVLTICVRALDYCPPVDLTFGDYLRALITADYDLVPDDRQFYRVAFIEAFRAREIYSEGVRTVSVDSLRWQGLARQPPSLVDALKALDVTEWKIRGDRKAIWTLGRENGRKFHEVVRDWLARDDTAPDNARTIEALGLDPGLKIEVHSVRPVRRQSPDGNALTDLVVVLTQRRRVPYDASNDDLTQDQIEKLGEGGYFWFRGGCTLIINRENPIGIRYAIVKRVSSASRFRRERDYRNGEAGTSTASLYFGDARRGGPFAMSHRGH